MNYEVIDPPFYIEMAHLRPFIMRRFLQSIPNCQIDNYKSIKITREVLYI